METAEGEKAMPGLVNTPDGRPLVSEALVEPRQENAQKSTGNANAVEQLLQRIERSATNFSANVSNGTASVGKKH